MKNVKKYTDKNNNIYISFINPITEEIIDKTIEEDEEKANSIIDEVENILDCKDIFNSYKGYIDNKQNYSNEAIDIVLGNINANNCILEKDDFFIKFDSTKKFNIYGSNIINIDGVVNIEGNLVYSDYFEGFIEFYTFNRIRDLVFDYIFETIYVMRNDKKFFNNELFNTIYNLLGEKIYVLNSYAISIFYTEKNISEKRLFDLPINEFKKNMHEAVNYNYIPQEIEEIIVFILDGQKNYVMNNILNKYNVEEFFLVHKNGFVIDKNIDNISDIKYVYFKIKTKDNILDDLKDNKIDKLIKKIRFKADGINDNIYDVILNFGDYNEYKGNSIVYLNGDDILSNENIISLYNAISVSIINISSIVFITNNKEFNKDEALKIISKYIRNNPIFIKRYNKDFYEEFKEVTEVEYKKNGGVKKHSLIEKSL